jgi:hypothetical protein
MMTVGFAIGSPSESVRVDASSYHGVNHVNHGSDRSTILSKPDAILARQDAAAADGVQAAGFIQPQASSK